jgi:hypothetical protein
LAVRSSILVEMVSLASSILHIRDGVGREINKKNTDGSRRIRLFAMGWITLW